MRGDFFDTNVLVYAASADDLKVSRAEALLSGGGMISVQVLNEFTNVARRKMRLDWLPIRHFLQGVRALVDICPLDIAVHDRTLEIAEKYRLHVYDSSIVAAALATDCTTLFTEDLHHGLMIEGRLRVLSPFRAA